MNPPIISEEKTVYSGFFSLIEGTLLYPDGSMHSRLCVERGDAVAVLLFDKSSFEYLFVRQFRYPTYRKGEPFVLEIPAGMIDDGETPEQAARREVREEVGCNLLTLQELGTFWSSPGLITERIHLFYGETEYEKFVNEGGGVDPGEEIEIIRLKRDTVESLLTTEACIDVKLMTAWLRHSRSFSV